MVGTVTITPRSLFEIGITEIMFEIGIMGFQSNPNQGFKIQDKIFSTSHFKLGLRDYTPFEIGIMGFTGPPLTGA